MLPVLTPEPSVGRGGVGEGSAEALGLVPDGEARLQKTQGCELGALSTEPEREGSKAGGVASFLSPMGAAWHSNARSQEPLMAGSNCSPR